MKKSFIYVVFISFTLISCGWLNDITSYTTDSLTQADVEDKTSCKSFAELDTPLIFTQRVYDEYAINSVGSIAVVYDCEKNEVFDWMYIENPDIINNLMAVPLQQSPESPITYYLCSPFHYKSYFLDVDGTLRTYDKSVNDGGLTYSKHIRKPSYLLVTDTSWNNVEDGERYGFTINTIDCTDGTISETVGLEYYGSIYDETPDQNGVYWFTSSIGPKTSLFYFDKANNKIVETPFYHSLYPDDKLQEGIEKYKASFRNNDDDDDETDDDDFNFGTENLELKYVSESKFYFYNTREYIDLENSTEEYTYYKNEEYILVVDRNDFSLKEYFIGDLLKKEKVSFVDLFETEGKIWLLAGGYWNDDTEGNHFYEFIEEEDGTCSLSTKNNIELWIKDSDVTRYDYLIRGKYIYFCNILIEPGITIYSINLETGEWDKKEIPNSYFQ